jgi:hypothetical protein
LRPGNTGDWLYTDTPEVLLNDPSSGRVTPHGDYFLSIPLTSDVPQEASSRLLFGTTGDEFYTNATLNYSYARGINTFDEMNCVLFVSVNGVQVDVQQVGMQQAEGSWLTRQLVLPGTTESEDLIGFLVDCGSTQHSDEILEVWLDNVTLEIETTASCPGRQR